MPGIYVGRSAGSQIKLGAAILAAARTADTQLIKDRLAAFKQVQQRYADAHAKVQEVEAELTKAQGQFRVDQQAVVDALARALQPRRRGASVGGGARGAQARCTGRGR